MKLTPIARPVQALDRFPFFCTGGPLTLSPGSLEHFLT
jgi:hypothetical protein